MSEYDERTMAVAFALADPGNGMPEHIRMAVLGLDMRPIAAIAVDALDKHDAEQIIVTTLDTDAITYFGKTPPV